MLEDRVILRARSGSELEAAPPEVLDRLRQSRRAGSGDEGRCEHDTVDEDRSKQTLDVLRNHVAAPVQERPGAGRPLQRKTPANRAADHDALLLTGRPYQLDDPTVKNLVHVDVLPSAAQ